MRLLRRVGRLAGGLLLAALVFFAAGEMLARVTGVVDRLNGFPRHLYAVTDDVELPYVLRPGFTGQVRGVPVRVNALGLRGPETSAVPPAGVQRVLALGDSATFGEGLAAEDAFPARLEAVLGARGGRWEVLNAGVQGYDTTAELAWLRDRGLALRPDAVVVGFNLNDFDRTPVMGPLGILTLDPAARVSRRSPAQWSEFWLLLRWLVALRGRPAAAPAGPTDGFTPAPGEQFSRFDRYVSGLRKKWWAAPPPAELARLTGALAGLAAETRARGIPLVVAVIPDGDQLDGAAPDLRPQERMAALCAELGLDCVDLRPRFVAAGGRLHQDIMHPNAAGQRLIAEALAERLLAAR